MLPVSIPPHPPHAVLLDELVAVLAPAPAGLRRWSVMNAIRKNRRAAGRDIPLKMESEVERVFRRFCAEAQSQRQCAFPPSARNRRRSLGAEPRLDAWRRRLTLRTDVFAR